MLIKLAALGFLILSNSACLSLVKSAGSSGTLMSGSQRIAEISFNRSGITGYSDAAQAPLTFSVVGNSSSGRSYQCRVGSSSAISQVPFSACNLNSPITVSPSAHPNGGTLVAEVKVSENGNMSQSASASIYVHPSLNRVSSCADAYGDDSYLSDAAQFLDQSAAFIATSRVDGPFISLDTGSGDKITGLTLRKKFVLNQAKTLALIKRAYVSNVSHSCEIHAREFDSAYSWRKKRGPANTRSYSIKHHNRVNFLRCSALVVNANDSGLCFVAGAAMSDPNRWVRVRSVFNQVRSSDPVNSSRTHSSAFTQKFKKADYDRTGGYANWGNAYVLDD